MINTLSRSETIESIISELNRSSNQHDRLFHIGELIQISAWSELVETLNSLPLYDQLVRVYAIYYFVKFDQDTSKIKLPWIVEQVRFAAKLSVFDAITLDLISLQVHLIKAAEYRMVNEIKFYAADHRVKYFANCLLAEFPK